jgi:hypothetical protein
MQLGLNMEENNGSLLDIEAGSLPVSTLDSGNSGYDHDTKIGSLPLREVTEASQPLSINVDCNDDQAQDGTMRDANDEHFNLSSDQEQQQLHNRRPGNDSSLHEPVNSLIHDDDSLGDIEEGRKGNASRKIEVQFHEKPPSTRRSFGNNARNDSVTSTSLRQCVEVCAFLTGFVPERPPCHNVRNTVLSFYTLTLAHYSICTFFVLFSVILKLRTGDTRIAMDKTARRWQKWRKGVAYFLGSRDEVSVGDDVIPVGGAKVTMHGRLMVQPSRHVSDIRTTDHDQEDGPSSDDEEEAAEKKREEMQYRLTAVKGVSKVLVTDSSWSTFFLPSQPAYDSRRTQKRARDISIEGMYEDLTATEGGRCCCFCCACHNDFNCERIMSAFLHWTFRSPFVVVFGSAAVAWLILTSVFAILIFLVALMTPKCIGGIDIESSPSPLMDAYQLSWTTFSTVVCMRNSLVRS